MNDLKTLRDQEIVASLTVGQLRDLLREILVKEEPSSSSEEKAYVYGLQGIQALFHCSHSMAQKYKDGILKDAIMQNGRKIVVDANKAMELFRKHNTCLMLFSSGKSTPTKSKAHAMIFMAFARGKSTEDESVPKETWVDVGMLRTEPINATIQRTKALPPPEPLFYSLWNEGEVACLFADSNVGKSILALQIAETIAEKRPVVYYDFEMEDRQLTDRYSVEETSHVFPDNLYRTSIIWSDETDKSFEDALIRDIELNTLKHGANVLIIDNLTFMCLDSEKGDAAGRLMIKLIRLKRKYGWSILVISHTPKRDEKAPIEPRHLAGSKRIFNFADSVFAMGKSSQDKHFRYIIQLKDRLGEKEYDQDNVIVMELEKAEDGNLHYIFKGTDSERNQLYAYDGGPDIATIKEVLRMKAEGHSFREIASAIDGVSKSTAQRIWKKYHDTIEQEPDTDVLALVS